MNAASTSLLTRDRRRDLSSPDEKFGNTPPLLSGNGRRAPDKRKVSLRWMAGSILTGVTSLALMGGALYAALDGRQQLAQPANILDQMNAPIADGRLAPVEKGDRPLSIVALQPVNERILQVPTVTRVGDANVIRKRPFAYASAPLAVKPARKLSYPKFNPLTVFRNSANDTQVSTSSDVIYGADIEGEVLLETLTFPLDTAVYDKSVIVSVDEAEKIVQQARVALSEGATQVEAQAYLDTDRFALDENDIIPPTALDIKITEANVSTVLPKDDDETAPKAFHEEVIDVPAKQTLATAVDGFDFQPIPLGNMTAALVGELGKKSLPSGTKLRIAWEEVEDITAKSGIRKTCRRISVYRAGSHIKSIALTDEGTVVWATEPALIPAVEKTDESTEEPTIQTVARNKLPNAYDGIFRAALSQGLNENQAERVVRTVAFDVDFRAKIKTSDDLEIFYSLEEGEEEATDNSEILYIGLTLDGVKRTYYRYRTGKKGRVDYYDETGKSAKKFLLRKPVPNGKFRSAFGPRRHPISRRVKMHQGVDFSAPRGTPIIAAGNGVVEKAGWSGGYGKQTIIRHANGYKTSYNHQHRFAKGIKSGARVRQGQIIGQVGSTGYSTGPHLHYEVIVNGNKVNPMKIRLPQGQVLKGTTLAAFKRERDRINALLIKGRDADQTIAALN